MYNNYVKGAAKEPSKPKKEVRKPVAANIVPKRFGMNVDPPMLVLEYLVAETGKLYHHKMRLQSKMEETLNKAELLAYVKHKHQLYFASATPKIKDSQVEKLLDKLLEHYELEESQEESHKGQTGQPKELLQHKPGKDAKGFDFLDYGQE